MNGRIISQQRKRNLLSRPEVVNDTRFIIVGASIMTNAFSITTDMLASIASLYPNEKVKFFNHGSVGATSTATVSQIDNILSNYVQLPFTNTYVIVHTGGNDVTNTRPFLTATSGEKETLENNLNYILDAIEDKGFTPILNDLTFRNYDETTYENEENGSLPYNQSIIQPLILSRTPEFAFEDGQSFFQLYNLIYNNYDTYLTGDGIHPNGTGYAAIRAAFVNTICKFIFTGITPTKIIKNGSIPVPPPLDNMYDEDEYLNAYLYPLAGATLSGLQNAIDTHSSVKLEAGTYPSGTIYIGSNQKLYTRRWSTVLSNVTILQGSTGVVLDGFRATSGIHFQAGSPITNNKIKNIWYTNLITTGGSIENNLITNLSSGINLDLTSSGYFRNNIIIKQWIHGHNPQNVFKGNTSTPSYGNLQIWLNNLTPSGYGNDYDTVEDVTIIGLDAEGWNLSSGSDKAMTYMRNIGNIKITDFGGGNGYSPLKTPPFDIQADNLYLLNANLNNTDTENNSIAEGNLFILNGKSRYNLTGGFEVDLKRADEATYDAADLNSTITDPTTITNIKSFILGTEKTPISRPNLDIIPNPAGLDWETDRIGKTDQAAYIQELINTNNIAELSEGIYYIGSTLTLKGQNEGINGAGTGKTVIVGITDDFPLITFSDISTNRRWFINNLTLQGGHTGLRVQRSSDAQMMVTGLAMHDVIFRDQTYGMHLYRFFGFDNNYLENVNFINCEIGLFQDPDPNFPANGYNVMMYLDKNVFYKTQVINCGIGFKMHAKRANNLNSWVDCVFDGNGIAVDLRGSNYSNFINCDFKNHTGSYVVGQSPISLYSCEFENNTTDSIFQTTQLTMEGCTILDDLPLLVARGANPVYAYIQNSTVTGDIGYLTSLTSGFIVNSSMLSNSNLNKLLVKIVSGTPTTLIDEAPTPYPQLLVINE